MTRSVAFLSVALVLVSWGATAGAAPANGTKEAPARRRLVVPALVAERGIDESVVRLLNELLLTEFQGGLDFEVLGASDVLSMLNNDQQRQLAGCTESNCLAELAGALDADYVTSSSIGRIGDFFLLNIKVIDVRTARVISRSSQQIEGLENKLLNAVRSGVGSVLVKELSAGHVGAPPGSPLPAQAEAAAPAPAQVAVAAAVAEVKPLVVDNPPVSENLTAPNETPALRLEKRETKQRWGWISLASAAAFAGGGGLMFVLRPSETDLQAKYDTYRAAANTREAKALYEKVKAAGDTRNRMTYAGWGLLAAAGLSAAFSLYELQTMPALAHADVAVAPTAGGMALFVAFGIQ